MSRRVLITGASGQLGAYLLRHFSTADVDVVAWSGTTRGTLFGQELAPVDLCAPDDIAKAFAEAAPETVVHSGAMSAIGHAYQEPQRAEATNTQATEQLAGLCERNGARLVYVSTDLVFDGERGNYSEDDEARPLSHYGRTKLAAEPAVRATPRGLVVRVSLLYGPALIARPTFFDQQLEALRAGREFRLFDDEWRTPLDLETAARSLAHAATSDVTGLLHLGGLERLSRWELGERIAKLAGLDQAALVTSSRLDVPSAEPRPRDTSFDSSRFTESFPDCPRPSVDEALKGFFAARD